MKRKSRKTATLVEARETVGSKELEANFKLIRYTPDEITIKGISSLDELKPFYNSNSVSWLNIYGLGYTHEIKTLVQANNLDHFIVNILSETNHRNKAIELNDCILCTVKALTISSELSEIVFEQIFFIVSKDFVWTVQEVHGDHFDHIRSRLRKNIGVARKKGTDYLFYLLIESIIESYYHTYEALNSNLEEYKDFTKVKASQEFAAKVETCRTDLLQMKKAGASLKEAINQMEKMDVEFINSKYLAELKEQLSYMNDDIDNNLQQLESSINLIFNIQNNRLNEVMKTLTIFSVIFIPLTFLAGIYGMNFSNMPELNTKYGYFVVLGVMACVVLVALYFIKRKNWFD